MAIHTCRSGPLTKIGDTKRPARQQKSAQQADQSHISDVIGYRLRLAQLTVFRDFIETFSDMDLKPVHYAMLRLIEANPGIRQGELARALGIKRANMVSLVNGLEERGIAERRAMQNDRRAYAVHLTDAGRDFATRMQEKWIEHEDRFMRRLGGEAEKQKLITLLDRIAGLP